MNYNPERHHRRSIRLRGYDYSQQGMYFVTICTWHRECLFGEIIGSDMKLNEYGDVVANCWIQLINHYSHIKLDAHIIMPNHMHGIINIAGNVGAGFKPAPTTGRHDLPEIFRALKTFLPDK